MTQFLISLVLGTLVFLAGINFGVFVIYCIFYQCTETVEEVQLIEEMVPPDSRLWRLAKRFVEWGEDRRDYFDESRRIEDWDD